MRNLFGANLRSRVIVWAVAAGLIAMATQLAQAAPKGPKHAAKKPAAKRPAVKKKLGPVKPAAIKKRTEAQRLKYRARARKSPYWVRKTRYWYPYYRRVPKVNVYTDLGYPYYTGGTNYVVVTPSTDNSSQSDESSSQTEVSPGDSTVQVVDTYVQMQELVSLIHEWRTMNESPEVHERLPSADAPEADRAILQQIHEENQAFDQLTRVAMRQLVRGQSATMQIDKAREHLEDLVKLVESLPESAQT